MLVVSGLSDFMNSTGAVAIFIPVTLNLAGKANIKPPRLLIPSDFAWLIGGMITLLVRPSLIFPNLSLSNSIDTLAHSVDKKTPVIKQSVFIFGFS